MSCPAQKASPAPVSTRIWVSGSTASSAKASSMSRWSCGLMALRLSGRFKISQVMPSCFSIRTVSYFFVVIVVSSTWVQCGSRRLSGRRRSFSRDLRQFEAAIVPVRQRLDRRHHLRGEQADVLLGQMSGQRTELQHADELLEADEIVTLGDAAAHGVGTTAHHDPALDQLFDLRAALVSALGGERTLE